MMNGKDHEDEEETLAMKYCGDSTKGLGKIFGCLTPKRNTTARMNGHGSNAKTMEDIVLSSEKKRRSRASSSIASLGQLSLSSRKVKDDGFCRVCGSRLGKSGKCRLCGGLDDPLPQEDFEDGVGGQGHMSVGRQRRARRATLTKYMAVVHKNEGRRRINTMDAGFRARLETQRKHFREEENTRRLKRAHSLKTDFLKGKTDMLRKFDRDDRGFIFDELSLRNRVKRESNSSKRQSRRSRKSSVGSTKEFNLEEEELANVPEDQEVHYNNDIDSYLTESLKQLEANRKALEKSERQLHLHRIKDIKQTRTTLLTEQDTVIQAVRTESKAVIKGLRKHANELMSLIKQKSKEGDDLDLDKQNQISDMDAVAQAFTRASSTTTGDQEGFDEVFHRERRDKKLANMLMQQRYENTLEQLQEELAATVGHLNDLELESYFPKCMQWKWRLNSGDGLFIGMRDLDLDFLDADVVIGRGDELGTVHMAVSNIRAIVGIYQFSIDGNTATSKLLRGLLTPTVNRLDLEISGNWELNLRFQPGNESKDLRPKWIKENSTFDLRLTKETAGASLLRLPDRVIRWLTTSLLPSVISNSIMLNLPVRLGNFFLHPQNYIRLTGKIHMRGDIPPRVWTAPFIGPTQSAKLARKAMGLSDEEAVLADLMFRSELATCAGFHRKAISMSRLFKWRLQYSTHPTSKLAHMLHLIESDPHLLSQQKGELAPDGWALQMLNRVCELAVKPVTFDLQIQDIEADINVKQAMDIFTGMYIESLEHEVEKAAGARAVRAAEKKLSSAKTRAEQVRVWLETYIAAILSNKVSFDFSFVGMGGIVSGILMASLRNVEAQLKLPKKFEFSDIFGEAVELSEGFNLTIAGEEGPEEGEYTLRAKHKWVNPKDSLYPADAIPDDDAQAIIRDLHLGLFPKGLPSGSIKLLAESVRASLFMCTLGEMTMPYPVPNDEQSSSNGGGGSGSGGHRRHSSTMPKEINNLPGDMKRHALAKHNHGGSVDELLQKSRSLVSDLWTRYYTSKAMTTSHADGSTLPTHQKSTDPVREEVRTHPILPKIMTDERHDLQIDLRGLKIQAIKEIGTDLKETVRVTISKNASIIKSGEAVAACHVRFSLQEIFESGEL